MKLLKQTALITVFCAGLFSPVDAYLTRTSIQNPRPDNQADISHLDFFRSPGEHIHVPDSGATAILLGIALAGFALARRFMKR